jgi:hypothetical protein
MPGRGGCPEETGGQITLAARSRSFATQFWADRH